MFKEIKKEIKWGRDSLILETGKIARQADGSVLVTQGGTSVLCTAVSSKKAKEGIDFFPLTIHYREMAFSAGKIPGGFFKREGRPSEKETLTARLIDRPIRPLFPGYFFNETQVVCTVISHDLENNPDILAMIGASAALAISGAPFQGPIAGARVGYKDGEYILNPRFGEEMETSALDLIVAATETSVMMVESEAKELSEEIMLGAVTFGHDQMKPVIKMIKELAKKASKPAWKMEEPDNKALDKEVASLSEKELKKAYKETDKQARTNMLNEVRSSVVEKLSEKEFVELDIKRALKKIEKSIVRGDLLKTGVRIDGRDNKTVRNIVAEVGVLNKTHGSSLFTRGETQALVVSTLGTSQDEQIMDALEGEFKQHFMLHYNFPPYSVGEATPMRPPGRREIGHGKLAWRALKAVMPSKEDFPYTIRVVSEITESNGSSSMATVCGGSLSMMDAGIPLKASVAGIAMGLIMEKDKYVVLSDILGDEDHLGDMDFKVAGTKEGITALQMDIKINGITAKIMKEALDQASEGRMHILGKMDEALTESRKEVSKNAPRIVTIQINKDKIREVIGTGGKIIKGIIEASGAKVEVDDSGLVKVAAVDSEASAKAVQMIKDIVTEPEVNKIYEGKVVKIADFGAFVNFMGSKDGLVHISELDEKRVEKVEDIVSEGDVVKVKVIGIDRAGKIKLSMRVVDQSSGEDITEFIDNPPKPMNDSAPSGGRYNKRPQRGGGNRSGGGGRREGSSGGSRSREGGGGGSRSREGGGGNRDRDGNRDNNTSENSGSRRKYFN